MEKINLAPGFQPEKKILRILYGSMFFFSFHIYIFLYIQSTFVTTLVSANYLGWIYGTGAAISLLVLLLIPKIFGKITDRQLALILIPIEAVICLILAYSQYAPLTIFAFILQQALIPILAFTLDILINDFSKNKDTGLIRGTALTAANITLVISPIVAGYIGTKYGFGTIFYISIIFLFPLFIMIFRLRKNMHEPSYHTQTVLETFKKLHNDFSTRSKDIQLIFMANFLLQIFYTWMVIYSPLYLLKQGFSWEQVGVIFTIMLLPFLLFQLPLGKIADRWLGEKEILAIGFIILGLSTAALAFIQSNSVAIWATALFMTRVGASCVEIMTETYFFKRIHKNDAPLISLFRFTRPISLLIAPVTAAFVISVTSDTVAFLILGILMLVGLRFVYPLVDTR
jgi:MFS family permease